MKILKYLFGILWPNITTIVNWSLFHICAKVSQMLRGPHCSYGKKAVTLAVTLPTSQRTIIFWSPLESSRQCNLL